MDLAEAQGTGGIETVFIRSGGHHSATGEYVCLVFKTLKQKTGSFHSSRFFCLS
jgi:hypothetical protein